MIDTAAMEDRARWLTFKAAIHASVPMIEEKANECSELLAADARGGCTVAVRDRSERGQAHDRGESQ